MNNKPVCRFPMQEQSAIIMVSSLAKNTIEIATDAENREKKNCKNTNYISGKVLEKTREVRRAV